MPQAIAMPASGRSTALAVASCQSLSVKPVIRTPSANSISGTEISPSILMPTRSGAHSVIFKVATSNPAMAANTTGIRHSMSRRACGSSQRAPKVKCRVFSTMNRITAAGIAASPQASNASGSPMLPELLNSIGGTRVFAGTPHRRANGQASSPQLTSSRNAPRASGA